MAIILYGKKGVRLILTNDISHGSRSAAKINFEHETGLVGCVQVAILVQSAINKPRQYPLEFDHSYR